MMVELISHDILIYKKPNLRIYACLKHLHILINRDNLPTYFYCRINSAQFNRS